jgi:hypothetical protein
MHKTRSIIGIMTAAFTVLAAATAASQDVSAENPGRLRVQTNPTAERQAVRADVSNPAAQAQARRRELDRAIAALDDLIGRRAPDRLTPAERTAWDDQTAWLTSVQQRYRALSESYAAAEKNIASAGSSAAAPFVPGGSVVTSAVSGTVGGEAPKRAGADTSSGEPMTERMSQLNVQFLALQNAVQMESRKYQTISNVSKARHDVAMSSIRNMK